MFILRSLGMNCDPQRDPAEWEVSELTPLYERAIINLNTHKELAMGKANSYPAWQSQSQAS